MNEVREKLPTGIVPIVQTPYDSSGDIDVAALERLVNYAIECGAAGLITPAVASEVERLSAQERKRVVETVVRAARDRVPVIVGASASTIEECVSLARHGQECGCRIMLVQAPSGGPEEILAFFTRLCREIDMDLIIQDLDWRGPGMPADLIRRLHERLPRFLGIKIETANACPKYTEVLEALEGRLAVSGGWAVMQLIEALDRGVHAFMPESSMVRIYEKIRRLHAAGNREGARALFDDLLPVLAFSNQHIEASIHFFKRLLVRRNIFNTHTVRPPTGQFDAIQERISDELIERVLAIESKLDSQQDGEIEK